MEMIFMYPWAVVFAEREESLRAAVTEFVAHYHSERHHQGLGNRIIRPEEGHDGNVGTVQRRKRLGGMLNYYYRAAA